MSETVSENNTNQTITTPIEIDTPNEEKQLLPLNDDNSLTNNRIPEESSTTSIKNKQKSLVSVYDNSNDGEPQQQLQTKADANSFPLVGILGRNKRSQAFTRRLVASGFPKPVLCDINSNVIDSQYVTNETFYSRFPSIILVTENLKYNFQHLIHHDKQQLIIDARETNEKPFAKISSNTFVSISQSYRAFGNLSNWEIENGTERVPVAVEQTSPINVIKFINDLNCFTRGILLLDSYSYSHRQIKSFRHCLFPFVATIITFSLCFFLSIIEYRTNESNTKFDSVYHQASSITGSTSLTLLSLLFLIRPILEFIEFIYLFILKKQQSKQNLISRLLFVQRWINSRRYLAWYSLSFAFLHLIFLVFSKTVFNDKLFFYPVLLGLFTLVLLCILSFTFFPWISERLLWHEYRLLTSCLGPFALLIGLLHVFIHWKYKYYYQHHTNLFTLKFLTMILPFVVLLLRFTIYGIIYPTMKLIDWIKNRKRKNVKLENKTEDKSFLA